MPEQEAAPLPQNAPEPAAVTENASAATPAADAARTGVLEVTENGMMLDGRAISPEELKTMLSPEQYAQLQSMGIIPAAPQVQPVAAEASAAETPAAAEPAAAEEKNTPADNVADAYRGIVKIEVAVHVPDFQTPWKSGQFGQGNGTGFMVSPGVFLTNAHVVANAERIYVSPYADSRKIPATVRHVAHDADLALVEIEDKSAFADVPCLELSQELPQLEDTVRAIGYPIGGKRLSVTRGIVSRIDTIAYAHPRNASHLALQIDAAINPGNSGGPVLKGGKVVGVAFQGLMEANSTGYVIPAPVIAHFLKDVEDGHYDGYVELGAEFMDAINPALRRHYGLAENAPGCLVADVAQGGCCDGLLRPGDIVTEVNGLAVDSSAMIELEGVRVNLQELAERSFNGDTMHFRVLRDGKPLDVDVKLAPLPPSKLMTLIYDELPRYVQFGGLVFQPFNVNVVSAHGIPSRNFMVALEEYSHDGGFREKQDIVLLTSVLPDEVNARTNPAKGSVVTKVNGEPVKGLAHLQSLLYPAEGTQRPPYTVIELSGQTRPLVFDNAVIDAANERIMKGYNIPAAARLNP